MLRAVIGQESLTSPERTGSSYYSKRLESLV